MTVAKKRAATKQIETSVKAEAVKVSQIRNASRVAKYEVMKNKVSCLGHLR